MTIKLLQVKGKGRRYEYEVLFSDISNSKEKCWVAGSVSPAKDWISCLDTNQIEGDALIVEHFFPIGGKPEKRLLRAGRGTMCLEELIEKEGEGCTMIIFYSVGEGGIEDFLDSHMFTKKEIKGTTKPCYYKPMNSVS